MMYGLSSVDKVSGRKAWGQHYDVQSVDKVSERKAWRQHYGVQPVICRQGQWEEGLGTII